MTDVRVGDLRFEHRSDTLGVGVLRPRLSWRTVTGITSWMQEAYEVEVGADEGPASSSGRIDSGDSVLVPWPASGLSSRERRSVRVRVWGTDGSESEWSEPTVVEAGLLQPGDWRASFVTPDWDEDTSVAGPCPHLRREFAVDAPVERARLYVTALGCYEIEINGERVGDHVLAPGWSSYAHRLRYEVFDVTDLVHAGSNAAGAILADGWYRGTLGFRGGRRDVYGERLALLAQLEIVGANGAPTVVGTDDAWRAATGPISSSGIYEGEIYDARLELDGWSQSGYDDSSWAGVRTLGRSLETLVARSGPPVRRTELIAPASIETSASGRTIVDFGQNLVGRLRVNVSGETGTTITLRHAEILHEGELCTGPLRGATATDRYTLKETGEETWEPRFTFHGFRYAEVDGWPGDLRPEDITAVVCHSDMERTGWFECSDERVNRLHENIVWGMRGNFLDVPTDCPQRDERLGWTGDIQVFAPTACFLFDCAGFLKTWLADLAADQRDDGVVPVVVPNIAKFMDFAFPAAGWSDAAVVVPWVVHERFGDRGLLREQYESMRAWVDHIVGLAGEQRLWTGGFQFGDWLDPIAPVDKPHAGRTDADIVASAYLFRSLTLLAEAAGVVHEREDANRYSSIADEVRDAFTREYVAPSGRVVADSQTAFAMALQFGLLTDPAQRSVAGARLAKLVKRAGYTIGTGFLGTPLLCDALCDSENASTAFTLLTQEECPSWLYPVLRGATTIWERWDGLLPDGRVNGETMNSFNHYAFGAVGDWLHRIVGGLAPSAPGYRSLRIAPTPGGGLTHASSRHLTPYGMAESVWRIEGDEIEVRAVVPPNTTATVVLPGRADEVIEIGSGTHTWRYEYGA